MFGDARASSLADLIEGSLMLKFNKAKRKAEKEMLWRSLLAPTSHAYPTPYLHPATPAVSPAS
jgi:hypothetical protein